MKQLQKVIWTKGVLLTPQHLQTQDRFLEDLLAFRLGAHAFCPWGFTRLESDREALAGGSLALSAAAGLFPDGVPFDIPGADAAPAPKALEPHWDPDRGRLDIHLAIPEHRPGGHNVSTARAARDTRYIAEVVLLRDENTGLAEKPIQVARRNLRLLAEDEALEGSSTLRVARVIRSSTGEFQLDPQFVPPLLDLAASDLLLSLARRLVEILSAKSSALAGMRRQRNQSLADFGVSDIANFWLLYTVNTHLPRFRHLFETRRGHPADLYAAMLELAGSLTTFSPSLHPRDLPAYDHADPAPCFTQLDERVRELLETVVPANHVTLPLKPVEPSVYAAAVDQDRYFQAPQIFLAVRAEGGREDMARKVPQLVKISSGDQIERLIRQALPGLALRHVPVPPGALPVKLDYQYFALERSGPEWDAIRLARNVAVYVPSDFPDPQLELVVLLPTR